MQWVYQVWVTRQGDDSQIRQYFQREFTDRGDALRLRDEINKGRKRGGARAYVLDTTESRTENS